MLTNVVSIITFGYSPFTTDIYIKRDQDRAAAQKTTSTPAKKQTKKDL